MRDMDSQELGWWLAYFQTEPIGIIREDLRFANLMSLIANMFKGKGPGYKPQSFMISQDFDPRKDPEYLSKKIEIARSQLDIASRNK
jgi:hypothetical protein